MSLPFLAQRCTGGGLRNTVLHWTLWLAEPLIRGVYGEKWVAAAGRLLILAFAWPFWLMENLSGAVVASLNRLGRELQVQIATLIVTVLAILIALPHGIDGVAWAIVGAAGFTSVFMLRLALQCPARHVAGHTAGARPGPVVEWHPRRCALAGRAGGSRVAARP